MKVATVITLLATALIASRAWAQEAEPLTAEKSLLAAPAKVLPIVDKNGRIDMVEYHKGGSDKAAANIIAGECRVVAYSDTSITFMGTAGAKYQMFVLNPSGPRPVIGLIETLATPIPDSRMVLYDSRWTELDLFKAPTLSDWLTPQGRKRRAEVEEALPFVMAEYSYDPATLTLTATNNMSQYFVPTDTPPALSLLHKQLRYVWDGKRFKPAKQ